MAKAKSSKKEKTPAGAAVEAVETAPVEKPGKAAGSPVDYDPKAQYQEGDRIFHRIWDDVGEVKEVGLTSDGIKKIKVQFEKVGTKILVMDHRG